jgi:hypothetical protein
MQWAGIRGLLLASPAQRVLTVKEAQAPSSPLSLRLQKVNFRGKSNKQPVNIVL